MITTLPNLPDNVIGFKASGTVTYKDYEHVLIPTVEQEMKKTHKLRMLYDLGKDFEGFEAGALWDDAKIGLEHYMAWEKFAIITDKEWVKETVKAVGLLMPAKVHVYKDNELNEALEWLEQ